MQRSLLASGALALAALLGACANPGTMQTTPAAPNVTIESPDGQRVTFDLLPKNTIGEELPSEGVGTKKDPKWGTVGGFTQTAKAQVLAFAPNTTVTIRNLSSSLPHTLDVVGKAGKPPAHFPTTQPPFNAAGNGVLGIGYASGNINPGKTVKVKLLKPGTYLIECAYHFSEGMRDVIRVAAGATPGPSIR